MDPHARHRFYTSRYRVAKIADDLGLKLRYGTQDDYILDEIAIRDVYRLGSISLPSNACVIDIGANVGIFSAEVLYRWPSAQVTGFELDDNNASIATAHLAGRARIVRVAIVGDHVPTGYRRDPGNSGGHMLSFDAVHGQLPAPPSLTLAQAFDLAGCPTVDLLKMDVEGAEYDILQRAARDGTLGRVRRVVMEWHEHAPGQSGESLVALLRGAGFVVESVRENIYIGTIFASRP